MMDISDTLEGVREALSDRLSTKIAYGDPVEIEGVTVIPVARVAMGFGAGGGVGEAQHSTNGEEARPVGGGGGGGGLVQPLGFIEIDSTGARWVAVEPSKAEVALRALMIAAIMVPVGGRRGLFGRLLLLLIGQLVASRMSQPNLPSLEGFRTRFSE